MDTTKILKREANYPITIPAKVRFDLRLTANEKLLYGELYTFGGMAGTFKVSNQRLAALYHVTVRSISAWLNKLAKCGYIELTNSLDKNEQIISFVPGVDPLDRDGYLYDEEVGHEEVIEAVAEPINKYDFLVDPEVAPEVVEAEMTARFGPIPDHLTPKQKAELREFRKLAYNKLHSKNSYDPKLRKEAQLGKALYAEEKITEFFNKLIYPLEKKSFRVEVNFQQEDNFQGLENADNTEVEENFMGKNTSRVENNFQSKLDNINSIVDKIIVGFTDIIKNINKLSDLRTTKNLISNQSA